jgi:CRISPR-associated protein Csx3
VDIGGKVTPENRIICAPATHIVLLAGNCPKTGTPWSARLDEWRAFAAEMGLTVMAEIFSDYHGTEDTVQGVGTDGVFRASVHFLDRTVQPQETAARAAVKALADFIVGQV